MRFGRGLKLRQHYIRGKCRGSYILMDDVLICTLMLMLGCICGVALGGYPFWPRRMNGRFVGCCGGAPRTGGRSPRARSEAIRALSTGAGVEVDGVLEVLTGIC